MLFFRLGLDLHAVLEQVGDQPKVARRIGSNALAVSGSRLQGAAFDSHLLDVARFHFIEKLRIIQLRLRRRLLARIELIEHSHQHQCDNQPDSDTFK